MKTLWFLPALAVTLCVFDAHAETDNSSLTCGDGATYYPHAWWAPTRSTSSTSDTAIVYHIQKNGINDSDDDDDKTAIKKAIEKAFDTWNDITCDDGSPKLSFSRGSDYDTRDSGDTCDSDNNCELDTLHHVIWFEVDSWSDDSSFLALTDVLAAGDTGRIATADMVFNAVDFDWRAVSSSGTVVGCAVPDDDDDDSICYDIQSTATHEAGHFLGLNHVDCEDAVMYATSSPSAAIRDLSDHETTGMCALYPPLDTSESDLQWGEACDFDDDTSCADGLYCWVPSGFPTGDGWGVCTQECESDDDCPTAFGCDELEDVDTHYCLPAPHDTGSSTVTDAECTSCTSADDCNSGLCIFESSSSTSGYCMESCNSDSDCSSDYTCTDLEDEDTSVCYPDDATCDSTDLLGLNDLCYESDPDDDEDTDDGWEGTCESDLVCFGFQASSCAQTVGGCVYECNSSSLQYNGERCPDPNQKCCYDVTDDLVCVNTTTTANTRGGCFTERRVGESCVSTDNAFCVSGARCLYSDSTSGSALCYRTCDDGVCGTDERCFSGTDDCDESMTYCCDMETYNSDGTCIPHGANFLREVGVECNENSECASDICYHLNGLSACSRKCNTVTGAGCPGNTDVNGDAKTDGGFTCSVDDSGEGWCWPKSGKPAEYLGDDSSDDGGCASAGANEQTLAGLGLILLLRGMTRSRKSMPANTR